LRLRDCLALPPQPPPLPRPQPRQHPPPQDVIQDRRAVYRVLRDNGIPLPTHIIVDRDGLPDGEDPPGFVEEVGGGGWGVGGSGVSGGERSQSLRRGRA
jgi:hypothetical protein